MPLAPPSESLLEVVTSILPVVTVRPETYGDELALQPAFEMSAGSEPVDW
jgi:hypothetical protein